jgi:hypothetical protein
MGVELCEESEGVRSDSDEEAEDVEIGGNGGANIWVGVGVDR